MNSTKKNNAMKNILSAILLISLAQVTSAQVLGGGLTGTGTRMLQVNSNGELTPLASGTSSQILFGNSIWGSLPVDLWTPSGSNIFFNTGYVGIGNTNPQYPLDVTGNARITGTLTAGGISATSSNLDITTPAIFTNSVTLLGDLSVNGTATLNQINITQSVSTPVLVTNHIHSPDTNGIHIGDSSMIFNSYPTGNPAYDNMRAGSTKLSLGTGAKAFGANSISIGSGGVTTNGPTSYAFGWNVSTATAANNAMALGSGYLGGTMVNNIPYSLAVGFNSTVPTLFVGGGNGLSNSIGKVGIGTTSPEALLHVNTSRSSTVPGLIVDDANPTEGPREFGVNSDGSTAIYYNPGSVQNDILSINSQGGQNQNGDNVVSNMFRIAYLNGNTHVGIGLATFVVGVGNQTPVSAYKMFTVNGDASFANGGGSADGLSALEILSGGAVPTRRGISVTSNATGGNFNFYINSLQTNAGFHFKDGNGNVDLVTMLSTGKVGIGTANPLYKFQVNTGTDQNLQVRPNAYGSGTGILLQAANDANTVGVPMEFGASKFLFDVGNGITSPTAMFDITTTVAAAGNSLLRVKNTSLSGSSAWSQTLFEVMDNGQVFIGTIRPNTSPYNNPNVLLSVAGQMVAQEMFVIPTTAWADYVFKPNYKLMPLLEVEKYKDEHGHLNNVPSAEEIKEKGQNVGGLQVIQMEKIEEHTLYLIEMKKEIIEMKAEIKTLKKENEALKKKMK